MTSGGTMFSKGDIVIIQFPFSDFANAKKRPMVVLAERGQDLIGCAITSNPDSEGIPIDRFQEGSLPLQSKIKYWQISTFAQEITLKRVAKITRATHQELLRKIAELFTL